MAVTCPKCQFENPEDTSLLREVRRTAPFIPEDRFFSYRDLQSPIKELTTGSTFAGRYRIIEELGRGGMGKVYKVLDTEIREEVALKLLNPEIASDEKTIDRFRNELKYARKITHRNVCRMHDINRENDTYFITMEYVPGEDLKTVIKRTGQLPEGEAVPLAAQVCEGLTEAHRLGVVHRDLKPQNIMIDSDGQVRIMDFGIARSLAAKGVTEAGMIIGTPDYMSPEQVEGMEADARSDIYALGATLYEMVTGRVPFEGDTALIVAMKHKAEIPLSPQGDQPPALRRAHHGHPEMPGKGPGEEIPDGGGIAGGVEMPGGRSADRGGRPETQDPGFPYRGRRRGPADATRLCGLFTRARKAGRSTRGGPLG